MILRNQGHGLDETLDSGRALSDNHDMLYEVDVWFQRPSKAVFSTLGPRREHRSRGESVDLSAGPTPSFPSRTPCYLTGYLGYLIRTSESCRGGKLQA